MAEKIDWHQLFGLINLDFFQGEPVKVDRDKDLSEVKQELDVVLILKEENAVVKRQLPDGMQGHLRRYNLVSFKSHQESLTLDAMDELFAYYVNYRKQASERSDRPDARELFQVFAVSAKYPEALSKILALNQVMPGVYDCLYGQTPIRILVASRLAQTPNNAILHLFSAVQSVIQYGMENYGPVSPDRSSLIRKLFVGYQLEGFAMPISLEEFVRKERLEFWQSCTPEQRAAMLQGVSPEERLKDIPPEVRLKDIPPEVRLKEVPVEQRLLGLTPEQRAELLRLLQNPPAT
jgi:hypothetical protein